MQMAGRKDKSGDGQLPGPRKSDLGGCGGWAKTSAEKVQGDWRKHLRAGSVGDM